MSGLSKLTDDEASAIYDVINKNVSALAEDVMQKSYILFRDKLTHEDQLDVLVSFTLPSVASIAVHESFLTIFRLFNDAPDVPNEALAGSIKHGKRHFYAVIDAAAEATFKKIEERNV